MFLDTTLLKYYIFYLLAHWILLFQVFIRFIKKRLSTENQEDLQAKSKAPAGWFILGLVILAFGGPFLFFNVFDTVKKRSNRDYLIPKSWHSNVWMTISTILSSIVLMVWMFNEKKNYNYWWTMTLMVNMGLALFLSMSCKKCVPLPPNKK